MYFLKSHTNLPFGLLQQSVVEVLVVALAASFSKDNTAAWTGNSDSKSTVVIYRKTEKSFFTDSDITCLSVILSTW